MTTTELDEMHDRCAASFFGLCEEARVEPMRQYGDLYGGDFHAAVFADGDIDRAEDNGATVRLFVFWTDGVANDWIQEVRDRTQAAEFLADLSRCCDRPDSMFTDAEAAKWADWRNA